MFGIALRKLQGAPFQIFKCPKGVKTCAAQSNTCTADAGGNRFAPLGKRPHLGTRDTDKAQQTESPARVEAWRSAKCTGKVQGRVVRGLSLQGRPCNSKDKEDRILALGCSYRAPKRISLEVVSRHGFTIRGGWPGEKMITGGSDGRPVELMTFPAPFPTLLIAPERPPREPMSA